MRYMYAMRPPRLLSPVPAHRRTIALNGCSAYCTINIHAPSASRSLATSATTAATTAATAPPRPHFAFGVIADVQWADEDDGSNYANTVVRHYRGAFRALGRAVEWWRALPTPPSFVAQLGDLIDGRNAATDGASASALAAALAALDRAPCRTVNLVGNHELYNFDRVALSRAPWLAHGNHEFYSFKPAPGWRVTVLDPYQISLLGHAADDPRRAEAAALLGRENPRVDPSGSGGDWFGGVKGHARRFVPYNGGLGAEQLTWLRAELAAAAAARERVLVLCHVVLELRTAI